MLFKISPIQLVKSNHRLTTDCVSALSLVLIITIILPIFLIFLIFLIFPKISFSAQEPVYMTSRRLEYHILNKEALANGDVAMKYKQIKLKTDKLRCDLNSGEALATGNVHLDLPQGITLNSPEAEFNINTGLWKIHSARIWLEPSGFISCEEAKQIDSNTIIMKKLSYTTCPEKKPFWEIQGKRGILIPKRYIKISHLTFRIKGVPLFFFPTVYLPHYKSKIKGLQPPEIGHSDRHGFFIKNILTWPVNPVTEGRLFLDFFAQTGIALGAGWEYSGIEDRRASEGRLYILREKDSERIYAKADISADIGRSDKKRYVVDVHSATKRGFDQKFSFESVKRDIQIEESKAFFSRYISGFSIIAESEHMRASNESLKNEAYIFPKLSCLLQPTPINSRQIPFLSFIGLDLSTSYINWSSINRDSNININQYPTMEKGDGVNFTIQPGLIIPIATNPWSSLTSSFNTKQSYNNTPQSKTTGWLQTYLYTLALTGPRLFKEYSRNSPNGQITHLIYPRVDYEYKTLNGKTPVSEMNMDEDIKETEKISILFINRIWKRNSEKGNETSRNLDLIISQDFNLKEKTDNFTIHALAEPHPLIGFGGRMLFDTKGGKKKDIDFNLHLGNIQKGEISLGWRYLWNDKHIENINTPQLALISKSYNGYTFKTSFIYNLKSRSRIEEGYSVIYQSSCWKASLDYTRRFDEDLFRANLSLVF